MAPIFTSYFWLASASVCPAWQNKTPPAGTGKQNQPTAIATTTVQKGPATPETKSPAATGATATAAPKDAKDTKDKPAAADADNKMSASMSAMFASIEKQKASVQVQAGKEASDSFFSVSWTSPASIPVPDVVPSCSAIPDDDLNPLITASAKAQDLKPELIRAVIRRESLSYPCAISDRGAIGLMQLMPEVAQQFNADPFDPKQNVEAGSRYLKQLMTRYKGDLRLALAAYNAGPQRVDSGNKVPDIPETTSYVDAILKDLNTNSSSR